MIDAGEPQDSLAAVLAQPAPIAAPGLLGATLVHVVDGRRVEVLITEVEAYDQDDPASHTFRGPTPRTATMFGPPGHLYAYRSHGIHVCANVVCAPTGRGAAVLLRGGVVTAGRTHAIERRGGRAGDDWLAAGPGRLCAALGITLDDDGADLLGAAHPRLVQPTGGAAPASIASGPRVGVTAAPDRPWRWWIERAPGVSAYRRSPRAAPPAV